ncbi:MAG: hypothetical protein FWC03_04245 [Treponema sp.]|nr:hypothetical protein [Treponema sp.]
MLHRKIYNIALIVTSIFVFFTWSLTNTINLPFFENRVILYLVNFASSFGFFKLFVIITTYILERITFVKKIIFGSSYFEGIWIGYYTSPTDGKTRIFFQIIDQTIDDVNIFSRSFILDKTYRGSWKSTNDVSINPKKSELSYMYEFDGVDTTDHTHGMFIGSFCKKGILKTPFSMTGNAFNYYSKVKIRTELIKVSNSTVLKDYDKDYDKNKLLEKALKFYKDEVTKITPVDNIGNKKQDMDQCPHQGSVINNYFCYFNN